MGGDKRAKQRMGKSAVLYISYDGMLEPLGQSQVIAYLERLTDDVTIYLLSFEKPADKVNFVKFEAMERRLACAGIVWRPLVYHKSPTVPATLFDIFQGTLTALWLVARHNVRIIHARSYVPSLIGWVVKLLMGTSLLFDMRGLWADERTDGGIWTPDGCIYRVVKRLERIMLLGADHIVTLTDASKEVIEAFPYLSEVDHAPISVIPTCADLDRFNLSKIGKNQPFTLGYLGSIGTWYMFDEVLACFRLIREQRIDARLLVVNRNEQDMVRDMVAAAGIPAEALELTSVDHAEVPAQVRRMSAGAAIIKPAFSKIASAPTKLAEYLGCGVPCLGNVGVGDMEAILEGEGAGVALRCFTDAERRRAVARLLSLSDNPGTAAHCREVALKHFSVEQGAARYRAIYQSLAA